MTHVCLILLHAAGLVIIKYHSNRLLWVSLYSTQLTSPHQPVPRPDINRVNVPQGVCCAPPELRCLEVSSIPRGPFSPGTLFLRHVSLMMQFSITQPSPYKNNIKSHISLKGSLAPTAKPDHHVNMQKHFLFLWFIAVLPVCCELCCLLSECRPPNHVI